MVVTGRDFVMVFSLRIKKEKTPEGKLKKYGEAVESLSGKRTFFNLSVVPWACKVYQMSN